MQAPNRPSTLTEAVIIVLVTVGAVWAGIQVFRGK